MNAEIAYQWRKQLVWGLLMIAVGCAFLLERAGYIDFDVDIMRLWRYWPWLVVMTGIIQIIPYLLSGLANIFFAGWWYVSFNRVWGWGFGDTWPALIVAFGVGLLLRPLLDNIFAAAKEQK
jgi:hypothetical protein